MLIIQRTATYVVYLCFRYSPAKDVVMRDNSFSPTEFELVHGLLNSSWDLIIKYEVKK